MKKASLLGASTVFALAMALTQPAFAQDAQPCPDDDNDGVCNADEESESSSTIVVTGTRIARPTLESSVPLTSVSLDELTGTGEVSLGDALNDLPSLRSTFSSGNSTRFIGTAGLSLLDLRGLGTDRTLVLVNGRRHVTSQPGDNGFDVNTVPTDLVQTVDIITGGNSAVYGSDAVAGVVNFILRDDYDGFSIRGQAGVSDRGDRGSYFLSGLWGSNFSDGRGNLTLSAEYTRQQPLLFRDRDALTGAFSGRCQFDLNDITTGEPAAGDGIPDQTFFCGVNNATISDSGTIGAIDAASNPTRRFLRFNNSGDIFIDTPTRAQSPFGGGNQIGGNGSTLRNTGSLLAEVNRYAFNAFLRYTFSDAFEPFIEAKFVRTEVSGEGQPSFFTSVPGTLGGPPFRCDNGFLSAQNLTQLRSFGLCSGTVAGTAIGTTGVLRGSVAQTMPLARFNTDFGGRRFEGTRDTYRMVGGIRGEYNDDWRYELAANYGRFEAVGLNRNNLLLFTQDGLNFAGFNNAVDAVIAPTTFAGTNFTLNDAGQRVICRINAVTNVDAACVPFNVFGDTRYDPRAFAYSHADSTTTEFADQLVLSGFVSGDFSQAFELPGGPISFVLGAEWRRERASVDYDELTSSGATFLNALQDFTPPDLEVKEAYGELQIPLLDDMPFAEELVLTLAGRVSDYNNSTGTVYSYNIQGVWAPVEDIRFRAAYATSVRAPTQGDLFSPQSENFAFIADPCAQANINANPNRVANCAAAGVPTTANAAVVAACAPTAFPTAVGAPWANCTALTSSTGFVSGGNPTLSEERGRSLTLGVIFEPRMLPGLNFTIDYYRIRVESLIAALTAQSIINLCYDSSSGIANPFCATVNRDPATGLFAAPAVVSGGVNFAEQRTEGVDFDLSYRRTFDNGHRLTVRGLATYVRELDNFIDPTQPTLPNRQLSELGDPRWAASFSMAYDWGNFDMLYSARYIGRMTVAAAYETQNFYTGICPTSGVTPNTGGINGTAVPCTAGQLVRVAPNNADAFDRAWYPDVIYHDIRLGWDVGNDLRFYAGVSNLFDRQPPLGALGTAGGDPYDSFGRNFFFGFRANW